MIEGSKKSCALILPCLLPGKLLRREKEITPTTSVDPKLMMNLCSSFHLEIYRHMAWDQGDRLPEGNAGSTIKLWDPRSHRRTPK